MPYYFDTTYLLLLPAILLSAFAQLYIKSVYAKASKQSVQSALQAAQAARMILNSNGLNQVAIELAPGAGLSDHYDPTSKTLRLSGSNYASDSVAALGVAAHEAGHAIQHSQDYLPMRLRTSIVPVANLGSTLSWPLLVIGLMLGSSLLAQIGVGLFTFALAFHLVTLPVEFDASRRAVAALRDMELLSQDELAGARKVLRAAALTYVAAAFMSLMQLLRLVALAGRGRNRR